MKGKKNTKQFYMSLNKVKIKILWMRPHCCKKVDIVLLFRNYLNMEIVGNVRI